MARIQFFPTKMFDDTKPIKVKLDGKIVGEIRYSDGSWRYYPKGSKEGGERFASLSKCKQSLESE